jgi:cytoskeletal protein RodZ
MIKNSHSHGSAHTAIIILVVALVGVLGFVFWQNFIYNEPLATKTETVAEAQSEAPKEEIKITELDKTLNLANAPYDDITYSMTSINADDSNKYVAAIYSKDLNARLVADQEKGGNKVSSEYEKLSCNKAVYAYYALYDEVAGAPGSAVDPSDLPEGAKLYVDSVGPCSASTDKLSSEYSVFRQWAQNNIE